MALDKAQLQALLEKDCTQQGAVSVPGAILKELVDNYIETVATSAAAAAAGAVIIEQDAIADLAAEAAVTAVVPVVNSILAALRENGIVAAA